MPASDPTHLHNAVIWFIGLVHGVVLGSYFGYLVGASHRAQKDAAYLERNQVVAALAKVFPSGVKRTAIPGWSEDWHGCVYIDLPVGQVSWHFHDSQAHLFAELPEYAGEWDGHSTEEKYERLSGLEPGTLAALAEREAIQRVATDLSEIAGIEWHPPQVILRDLVEHIRAAAHRAGQEEMRERAAQAVVPFSDRASELPVTGVAADVLKMVMRQLLAEVQTGIRALPTRAPDQEGTA